ncbi:MAG: hypothetical protein ACN6O3_06155 [Comamonas sp.]
MSCPAYPPLVRALAVAIVAALAACGLYSLPTLRAVHWSFASLATYGLAAVLIVWVGWWIWFSRTQLDGDELLQTWLWDKRVQARDVATFKIVHWPWFAAIVSPRMLVRKKSGLVIWMHAADAQLLAAFGERVVQAQIKKAPPETGGAS